MDSRSPEPQFEISRSRPESWHKCVTFCDRLADKAGKRCRLPNEAEWEYTCRAGTTTPFYFGETITADQASYSGDYPYGNGPKGVTREAAPVGTFPPNNWGILKRPHGNVFEW